MSLSERSFVWEHFDKTADNKHVHCNICKREFKFFSSTTNLKQHLKREHPLYISDMDRGITPNHSTNSRRSNKLSIRSHHPTSSRSVNRSQVKTSFVWKYFSRSADKKNVECLICEKDFKFFGSTTNMKRHLLRTHPLQVGNVDRIIDSTVQSRMIPKQEPQSIDRLSSTKQKKEKTSLAHSPSSVVKRPSQLCLLNLVCDSKFSNAEVKDIDDILLEMIVVDLQPLSVVDNSGFIKFCKKLQPLYTPPSKEILTSNLLPAKYNQARHKLQSTLNKIEFVSVTVEIWTSGCNKAFITASAHYILDTKMYSPVLATKELPECHTSENVALVLAELFEEFNISNKIVVIVSDNDSNVTNAVTEHLQKLHHHCVGQMLNLTVIDAIKENSTFSFILEKCRTLVFFFKNSAAATQSLIDTQQELNLPILNVISDIPTCWNSALKMLQRLVLLTTPISATIPNLVGAPPILDEVEWQVIHDCIPILEPLDEMITLLGENYPTLSMIIPLITGIQYHLEALIPTTEEGQLLQGSVIGSISKRLGIVDQSKLAAISTFLDPRFKKAGFGNEICADEAQKWISQELTLKIGCAENESHTQAILDAQGIKFEILEPSAQSRIWSHFDSQLAQKTALTTPSMRSNLLLEQYLEMPHLERTKNPLKFWANHILSLRELYNLHLKYLCVPGTSVPLQRLFSKTGQTSDRRNSLPSKYVDQIMFLNSAYKNNLV